MRETFLILGLAGLLLLTFSAEATHTESPQLTAGAMTYLSHSWTKSVAMGTTVTATSLVVPAAGLRHLVAHRGEIVTFHNLDPVDHNFSTNDAICDSFNDFLAVSCNVDVPAGQTVTFTIHDNAAPYGTFAFFCRFHPLWMNGRIEIVPTSTVS